MIQYDKGLYSTTISLDTIQNIAYANTDSGIWRNHISKIIEDDHPSYSKGFLSPNVPTKSSTGKSAWKYLPETKTIAGLHCQRAQHVVAGKVYLDVWFCSDIPFNFGPTGFHKLPGLIVEMTTSGTNKSYSLESYEVTTNIDDKIFWPAELNYPVSHDFTLPGKHNQQPIIIQQQSSTGRSR